MRALSAAELIGVWERGLAQHPVDRALTLLSACCQEPVETLAVLSIGQRDARLLETHARLFGTKLAAFAECPGCRERLEYSLHTYDLAGGAPMSNEAKLSLNSGETLIRLRLPNSLDLAAVRNVADVGLAVRKLAERCVLEADFGGNVVPANELPDDAIDLISARLAEADPQAEMMVDLTCAACRCAWQVVFDIESFLWMKISALARRLLHEVHVLAQAYGWREPDILALSSIRRQSYLEMVAACPGF